MDLDSDALLRGLAAQDQDRAVGFRTRVFGGQFREVNVGQRGLKFRPLLLAERVCPATYKESRVFTAKLHAGMLFAPNR